MSQGDARRFLLEGMFSTDDSDNVFPEDFLNRLSWKDFTGAMDSAQISSDAHHQENDSNDGNDDQGDRNQRDSDVSKEQQQENT